MIKFLSFLALITLSFSILNADGKINAYKEKIVTLEDADKISFQSGGKLITEEEYKKMLLKDKSNLLEELKDKKKSDAIFKDQKLKTLELKKVNTLIDIDKKYSNETLFLKKEYETKLKKLNTKKSEDINITNSNYIANIKKLELDFIEAQNKKEITIQRIKKDLILMSQKSVGKENKAKTKDIKPFKINSIKTFFSYIREKKSLQNVILNLELVDSLSVYIKLIDGKKVYPYSIEDRVRKYIISLSTEDDTIDEDIMEDLLVNKSIEALEQATRTISNSKIGL